MVTASNFSGYSSKWGNFWACDWWGFCTSPGLTLSHGTSVGVQNFFLFASALRIHVWRPWNYCWLFFQHRLQSKRMWNYVLLVRKNLKGQSHNTQHPQGKGVSPSLGTQNVPVWSSLIGTVHLSCCRLVSADFSSLEMCLSTPHLQTDLLCLSAPHGTPSAKEQIS